MAAAKRRLPGVRILINNTKVRVQEVRIRPGNSTPMLARPDRVQYILKGGKTRLRYPSGRTKVHIYRPGAVLWRRKEKYASENVGKTEIRFIAVRLK
jgi:hypothetical protein